MSDLKVICEKYFMDGVKPRHLRPFDETTPEGNKIKGYISVKDNRYMGSCLITHVNGEETNQFIQSMPKLHYFKDMRDIGNDTVSYCFEKLDGTCLILYPLKNKDGEVIEIVPKIRNHPVMPSHFRELYNRVDHKPIQDYYQKSKDGILIFELHGVLNPHQILHYDTGIGIKLLTVFEYNMFYMPQNYIHYGFEIPDTVFKLMHVDNEWVLKVTTEKFKHYLGREIYTYPTQIDAIDGIKDILGSLNKEYVKYNGINAIEGVVIYTSDAQGNPRMLKCKPYDIEMEHRSQYGIPRRSITKEVLKYFDEYGDDVKEIYLEDENHHTEFIHRMLSEDYPPELIKRSAKKIERIFMQIWDARQVPESLYNISQDLIDEFGDEDISTIMREFAKRYPMKKKQSRTVYGIIQRKLKKQGA
ncbi:MAG: hypothetical protein IJF83_07530 [Methanobrevibacter sp.]|nr:hypothetical protein [Methanobrevibacter sp.]